MKTPPAGSMTGGTNEMMAPIHDRMSLILGSEDWAK
jgi:putative SOS response-associated peptidase YedK